MAILQFDDAGFPMEVPDQGTLPPQFPAYEPPPPTPIIPVSWRNIADPTHPYRGDFIKHYGAGARIYGQTHKWRERGKPNRVIGWVPGWVAEPKMKRGDSTISGYPRFYFGYETTVVEREHHQRQNYELYPVYVNWWDFNVNGVPNVPFSIPTTPGGTWDAYVVPDPVFIYNEEKNKGWHWHTVVEGHYFVQNRAHKDWFFQWYNLDDAERDIWNIGKNTYGTGGWDSIYQLMYRVSTDPFVLIAVRNMFGSLFPTVYGYFEFYEASGDRIKGKSDFLTLDKRLYTYPKETTLDFEDFMFQDPIVVLQLVGGADHVYYKYSQIRRFHLQGIQFEDP